MATFWKKKQFWGSLIAIALLAYCVKDLRFSELDEIYQRMELVFFIPALLLIFVFVVAKAVRWRVLLGQHRQIPLWHLVPMYSAGQILNIVMPALTGQVGRMFLFAKKGGMRKTFVASTIILETLYDAISLVVFLMLTSVAFVFPSNYRTLSILIGCGTAAALVILYLVLNYRLALEEFGKRRLRDRWPATYVGVRKFLRSFTQGIQTLRSSQRIATAMALSFLVWLTHIVVIYCLIRSFGYDLPLGAAATVMIVNTLALMVPITPGNAGTFEVAVSTSLAAFSIPRSDAVLIALSLHLVDLLPLIAFGAGILRSEKESIKEISTRQGDTTILDEVDEDGCLIEREAV